jgi:subtilisin
MMTNLVGRKRGPTLAGLLVIVFCVVSSAHGGKPAEKNNSKDEGDINPTSIAVVDDDLLFSTTYPELVAPAEELIEAPVALQTATGRGVKVAVLDGGFNLNHPAIQGNLSADGYDAIDDDSDPHDPGNGIDDDHDGEVDRGIGHGTFVAGMILEAAPDVTIIPVRVRDDEGRGTNEALTLGVQYAMAQNVDVMNLSVSNADTVSSGLLRDLRRAVRAGIVLVLSAGNDGQSWLNDIAYGTGRIAVGAVDSHDNIAPFSNVDLYETGGLMTFAPGVDLYGPTGFPTDESMGYWSGTSFSAGFVSGAVALHKELRPNDSPQQVIDALKLAVDPVYWSGDDSVPVPNVGRINLNKVVSHAR